MKKWNLPFFNESSCLLSFDWVIVLYFLKRSIKAIITTTATIVEYKSAIKNNLIISAFFEARKTIGIVKITTHNLA